MAEEKEKTTPPFFLHYRLRTLMFSLQPYSSVAAALRPLLQRFCQKRLSPPLPIKSSLHQRAPRSSSFSSAFALRTPDNSLCAHLLLRRRPRHPLASPSALGAGDPLSPLYLGLPSTWPRADYILDITAPDVYDENKHNVNPPYRRIMLSSKNTHEKWCWSRSFN